MSTMPKFADGTLVTHKDYGSEVFRVESETDGETGELFYLLESDTTFGLDAGEEDLTLWMEAEKANARRIPKPAEIASAIDWLSTPWGGEMEFNQSDQEGEGAVSLYGRTADGMSFGCTVKVTEVWTTN